MTDLSVFIFFSLSPQQSIQKFYAEIQPSELKENHAFLLQREEGGDPLPANNDLYQSNIDIYGVCKSNQNESEESANSRCPRLLIIVKTTHYNGDAHLKAILFKNDEHYLVPYVDLQTTALTTKNLYDLSDLAVRSAIISNKKCTYRRIFSHLKLFPKSV